MTGRALLIVLDGVGIGGAPDAAAYGDAGADTLGHLHQRGLLDVPTLRSLGLGRAMGLDGGAEVLASWARMRQAAAGKDSTTGHWELAGAVLDKPFAVYPSFPPSLLAAIEAEANTRFLGNRVASGTEIIETLGGEHLRTGRPILYTSADSVLQIAAHEAVLSQEALYSLCGIARRAADPYRVGRVIARPFAGVPGSFRRTAGRHDFAMAPPPTILDAMFAAGLPVVGIGKVADLFAGHGVSASHPTASNEAGMQRIESVWEETRAGLVFANLVDFDTEFGHRRDATGFAAALSAFDRWLAGFLERCAPDDLLLITADHGNDPTFRGTDHTREEVPLLIRHANRSADLGHRETLADVAATLAAFFGLEWAGVGTPICTAPAAAS